MTSRVEPRGIAKFYIYHDSYLVQYYFLNISVTYILIKPYVIQFRIWLSKSFIIFISFSIGSAESPRFQCINNGNYLKTRIAFKIDFYYLYIVVFRYLLS